MSVARIRELVEKSPLEDKAFWALLEQDGRIGVRRLAVRLSRRFQRQEAEKERLGRLLELERRLWGRGIKKVAGVDEVGRGCLAGPVVAAAVILPQNVVIPGLDDSKKLSPEKREQLLEEIVHKAVALGVARVEAEEIDRLNILQASLQAMRLALARLGMKPEHVLVDGNRKPGGPFPELAVVDGDARSLSIAAASVVAKVHRDRMMVEYGQRYPQYGFASHKGYGSPEHLKALRAHGPCPLHRRSFGPVVELAKKRRSAEFLVFAEGLESCQDHAELERLGYFIKEGAGELDSGERDALRGIYKSRLQALNRIGKKGEIAAADFLASRGYDVLERGYRGAGGEIDLVARQQDCLVFVEVKSSLGGGLGHPEERVRGDKRAHLARAAQHYLQRHKDVVLAYRFDVIAVLLGEGEAEITHLENAFQT